MEARRYFLIYFGDVFRKHIKLDAFTKHITVLAGIFVLCSVPFHCVSAYSVSTHAFLTSSAFEFYNSETANKKISKNLGDFLMDGSRHEESPPRQTNHYYDPIRNQGLRTDIYHSYSAKEWAASDEAQNEPKWKITAAITSALSAAYQKDLGQLNLESDFAWERAKYFYRAGDEKKAFYVLGHILHLVQDMSVPAYTRNDFASAFDEDPYVWWTRQFTTVSPDYALKQRLAGKRIVTYPALGGYFDALATYSNTRFYSKDSVNAYDKPVSYTRSEENGEIFRLAMDPEFGVYHLIKEGDESGLYLDSRIYTLKDDNDKISSDYWRILSTKAVQYSAGVIDLFFREVAADANKPLGQDPETSGRSVVGKFVTFVKEIQQMLNLAGGAIKNETVGLLDEAGVDVSGDSVSPVAHKTSAVKSSPPQVIPAVSMSSVDVKRGETVLEQGNGFTPNGFVTLHFILPDGRDVTAEMEADKTGSFVKIYAMPTDASAGDYVYYAVDVTTGKRSSGVRYRVAESAEVQPATKVSTGTANTNMAQQVHVVVTPHTDAAVAAPTCSYGQGGNPRYSPLVINEIAWMGTTVSSQNEWVELKNIGNAPVNLRGYQLINKSDKLHITFDALVVPVGGYILLERTDDESVPGIAADTVYTGALGNNNEGLRLFDAVCTLLDGVSVEESWPAGDNDTRQTMERAANLTWQTSTAPLGTPRSANSGGYVKLYSVSGGGSGNGTSNATVPVATSTNSDGNHANNSFTYSTSTSVLIGEILPGGGTGLSDTEWVKLYNPTAAAVNLAGWSLLRGVDATSSEVLVQSFPTSTIPSLGFYLVGSSAYAAVSGTTVNADAFYSGSTHLSYTDALLLVDAEHAIVDAASYDVPTRGKSVERYAYDGSVCHEPSGAMAFSGNGCPDALWYENDSPRPQNKNSMSEPRNAPVPSADAATFTYDSASVMLSGNWSPYVDAMGNKNDITYVVTDATGGSELYRGSSAGFSKKLLEVGRVYGLRFQAFDKDGFGSAVASSTVTVPNFLDGIYFYPDSRPGGTTYLVEGYYGSYPFVPDVYQGGANTTWKGVIFSLNREPVEDESLITSGQFESVDKNGILNLRYRQCSGSDTPLRTAIFPDAASACSIMGGGLTQQGLLFSQLEDAHFIIESASSSGELALTPSDYLTASFYAFYSSSGGEQRFKLVAVDRTKRYFQTNGANKFAPVLGTASTTFDNASSKLTVKWTQATDADTLDSALLYDINFSPSAGFDESLWQRVSTADAVRLAYDRNVASNDSFIIGVRAVDDFGNVSEPVHLSWSYPAVTEYISQNAENGWSGGWGYVPSNGNAYTSPDAASFQSVLSSGTLSFNFVKTKVKCAAAYGTPTSVRLSVYGSDGAHHPQFTSLMGEARIDGVSPSASAQELTFIFSAPLTLSAGTEYWLALDIADGGGQAYFQNRWYNAIMTGGGAYAGGRAGSGNMRGNLGSCGSSCSFNGDYDAGPSDWYFILGLQ